MRFTGLILLITIAAAAVCAAVAVSLRAMLLALLPMANPVFQPPPALHNAPAVYHAPNH